MASENKDSKKKQQLNEHSIDYSNKPLTTRQGVKVNDTNNSLKAGERGATLLEDFLLREKITNFDHERIPERGAIAQQMALSGELVYGLHNSNP